MSCSVQSRFNQNHYPNIHAMSFKRRFVSSNIKVKDATINDFITTYVNYVTANKADSPIYKMDNEIGKIISHFVLNQSTKILKITGFANTFTQLEKFLILFIDKDLDFNKSLSLLADYLKTPSRKKKDMVKELKTKKVASLSLNTDDFDKNCLQKAKEQYLETLGLTARNDIILTDLYKDQELVKSMINNLGEDKCSNLIDLIKFIVGKLKDHNILDFLIRTDNKSAKKFEDEFENSIREKIKTYDTSPITIQAKT